MALFKISRGNAADLWTSQASKAAKNGYAWFTQDDGRFYIDVKDANTAVLNDSRIPVSAYHALKTIINSKTYTNVVCSANNDPNGYLYFGKIHRTNYYDVWHVKYRLYFTVGGTDDGHSYHEVDYYGSKNTYYAYRTYNAIANTGVRPMYNHVLYTSTTTGVNHNDHNGGLLGIRFYSSYNPATAANARTVLVEIIEEDNCTVELLSAMQTFANLNVSGHYQSRYELDGTTQGNTMSGDRNSTDQLYSANGANRTAISTADGGIGLHRYTLQMMNAAGNFTSIAAKTGSTSNNNDAGTDKTATTASLLIHGPIFYMSNNTYVAAGSSGNVNGYTALPMDFRYTTKCGTTLLVQKPVYLVGTPDSDSTFKVDATTWYTQTLPTTADGKIYIYLGIAYANYCIYLVPDHPVFEFKNGELRQFTRKSTISVAEGGTGNTKTPSALTNLGSTTAGNPYADAPRFGVTGTLPVGHGGTGNTTGTATYATTTEDTSGALYPIGVLSSATTTLKRDTSITLSGARFSPTTNNTGELGNASHKFAQVYATNLYGTFNGNLVGNADTASILKYHAQLTTKEAVDTFHTNGTGIQAAKVSSIAMNDADTWNSNDGMIIDIPWHATYGHQIYIDDSSYQIHHRFGRTKTVNDVSTMDWQPWVKALYTDSRTAVGTATQPIYIDANGKVIAGTALGASAYHADSFFALAGHNHDSVYLKLSGGTMTGVLTTKGSMYEDSYSGALNLNNSNIYGVNSIYTCDTSDNAAEGIHFYRDATHVDSLWMNGGNIYFVPNRALGTSTTAANSQKVLRGPATITTGYVFVADGTTGLTKQIQATNSNTASTIVQRDANGSFNAGAVNLSGDLNLYTASADSPDIVWWYANKGKEQARIWVGSGGTTKFAPLYRCYDSEGTSLYSGTLVLGDGTGASGTWGINITGNAGTATKLQTVRQINGTNFDGSGNITTANWGTARTLTIGNKGQSVNGSANVSWTLQDVLIRASNEFNFTADGIASIHFNHKTQTGTSATTAITEYYFKNGQGATTGVTVYAANFNGLASNASRLSNTSAIGAADRPVYFTANGVPKAGTLYAGGTAVTLNNASKAGATASFYAPTAGGTANTQALVGNGATSAPKWVNITPSITITAGTSTAAPSVNVTVLGQSGTAQSITTASTSKYGVTKLTSGYTSTDSTLAATGASILAAIQGLDVTAITGTAAQTITSISETDGKISATYSNIAIAGTQITSGTINTARLPADVVKVYDRNSIGTSPNYDTIDKNGLFELRASSEVTGEAGTRPFAGYGPFLTFKYSNVMLQLAGNTSNGWYIRGIQSANVTLAGTAWSRLVTNSGTWSINITGSSHSVLDSGDSSTTTFAYSKAGLNYADYTQLAAWNGRELRAVNKSQFASAAQLGNYLPLAGGTMTGALNFANGTWNSMGDDCYIGDCNISGCIGLKGNNGTTGLNFVQYGGSAAGKLTWDGSQFLFNSEVAISSVNGLRFTYGSVASTESPGTTNQSVMLRNDGSAFWILCCDADTAGNNWYGNHPLYIDLASHYTYAYRLYGAVWNDYAEYRSAETEEPGRCVQENDNGHLTIAQARLIPGCAIISDTYGFAEGETDKCKTPVAVSGRVLAYPYRDRKEYHAGQAVCSAPNGTVDIMSREEITMYPDCIIGIVSEIPDYETWGTDNIQIDNRIWIKVK